MVIEDIRTLPDSASVDEAAEPLSAAWWQLRTAEELRDIINRGFSGGGAFQAAVAETERRAREATKRLRESAVRDDKLRRRRIMYGAAASTAALIAAFAGVWLSY